MPRRPTYTIAMSSGDATALLRTDFNQSWNAAANRAALVADCLYLTRIEVITDSGLVDTAGGPLFLNAYRTQDDETDTSHLWTMPIVHRVDTASIPGRNELDLFQPLDTGTLFLVFTTGGPWTLGTALDMGSDVDDWVVEVEYFKDSTS